MALRMAAKEYFAVATPEGAGAPEGGAAGVGFAAGDEVGFDVSSTGHAVGSLILQSGAWQMLGMVPTKKSGNPESALIGGVH